MEKFTKIIKDKPTAKEESNILWENKYMKVLNLDEWTVVEEKDMVVCIPYLVEENKIILRQEYIPTYNYVDGQNFHLTVLSGSVEKDEEPSKTIVRELEEEAGIILREDFPIEIYKSLFVSKGNTAKYHICLLTINENDYHQVIPKGDGSDSEAKSKTIKIDVKNINNLMPNDTITELLLLLTKCNLGLII